MRYRSRSVRGIRAYAVCGVNSTSFAFTATEFARKGLLGFCVERAAEGGPFLWLRGFKVFREVCANCHGAKLLAFRNLAEEGGPMFSEEQVKALAANLKTRVGRDVQIQAAVDPAILGGLVVQLGSQLIDGSIRTRLNSFAQAMKG